MMIARRSMMLSRMTIVLLAAAIGWMTGVRAPRAQTFGEAAFAGKGRATLTITRVVSGGGEGDGEAAPVEVYARMTFGTELSAFQQGLYARSSFTMPGVDGAKGITTVLVVDVDRAGGRRSWEPDVGGMSGGPAPGVAGNGSISARLYEVVDEETGFDARPRAGRLELEASVVTRTAAGFRLRGWLAMLDPGPDGLEDTRDDLAFDVELTLESVPSPEALAGQGTAPLPRPVGGVCDPSVCWVDAGYYDTFYGYGCSDAVVDDGSTSDGCGGEPDYSDDAAYDDSGTACEGDGSSGYDDNGNPTGESGDVACEGDDVEADSAGGCEADDASSGSGCEGTEGDAGACGGSDAGSGCSGCEGDAALGASGGGGAQPGHSNAPLKRADLTWVGLLMLGLAVGLQGAAKR